MRLNCFNFNAKNMKKIEELKILIDNIHNCKSTSEAEQILNNHNLTIKDLLTLNKLDDFDVSRYVNKQELISKTADNLIGFRLRSKTIKGDAKN
jgi:predicted HAD superfamily hydrolase